MLNAKKLKNGQNVYGVMPWSGFIFRGTFNGIREENKDFALVTIKYQVDDNDNVVGSGCGNMTLNLNQLWGTAKEAYEAARKESERIIKKYCESITSVESLLAFPLDHCFCGEEYTDYEAIAAYKIRCKELLGFEPEMD